MNYWTDLRNPLLVVLLGCIQLLPDQGVWGTLRIVLDLVLIAVWAVSLILAIRAKKRGEKINATRVTSGWMTWVLLIALVFYLVSLTLNIFEVLPWLQLALLAVGLVMSVLMLVLVICRMLAKKD